MINSELNLSLADSLNMGLVLINQQGEICLWNRWMADHSRLATDKVFGKNFDHIFRSNIDLRINHAIREALDFGWSSLLSHALHPMPLPLFAVNTLDNKRIKQGVEILPITINHERMCLLQVRNVTEIVRREHLLKQQAKQLKEELQRVSDAQHALQQSELRFRELARQAPAGLFELDKFACWTFMNERCCQILGVTLDKYIKTPWLNLLPMDENIRLVPQWILAVESNTRFAEECQYTHPHHDTKTWLRIEAGIQRNINGEIIGYIGTVVDISDYHKRLIKSEFRASHDSLTGLHNREYFEMRAREHILESQENNTLLAVLFIDLNGFKDINDTYGHATGDIVIKTVATRLRRTMRSRDIVCRLGGDEFAILVPHLESATALTALNIKINQAISLPINIGIKHISIQSAIGISIYPDHGNTIEQLIHHADHIMYDNKRQKSIKVVKDQSITKPHLSSTETESND